MLEFIIYALKCLIVVPAMLIIYFIVKFFSNKEGD